VVKLQRYLHHIYSTSYCVGIGLTFSTSLCVSGTCKFHFEGCYFGSLFCTWLTNRHHK